MPGRPTRPILSMTVPVAQACPPHHGSDSLSGGCDSGAFCEQEPEHALRAVAVEQTEQRWPDARNPIVHVQPLESRSPIAGATCFCSQTEAATRALTLTRVRALTRRQGSPGATAETSHSPKARLAACFADRPAATISPGLCSRASRSRRLLDSSKRRPPLPVRSSALTERRETPATPLQQPRPVCPELAVPPPAS